MKRTIRQELNTAPMREWVCRKCFKPYMGYPSLCPTCKAADDAKRAAEDARSLAFERDHERRERAAKLARRRTELREFDSQKG